MSAEQFKVCGYTVFCGAEGRIVLIEYASRTEEGVLRKVLQRAQEQGYTGKDAMERIQQLGWHTGPLYCALP